MKHNRRTVKTARRARVDVTPQSFRELLGLVTVARINARNLARS